MDLNTMQLPAVDLRPGQDEELARAVEAGVYAEQLLASRGADPELERVVALGREAQARMWSAGMRIAMQQARRAAVARGLPAEDLFQDACVAVAEAILRYDFTRGTRFTTFAFESVSWALGDGSRHRTGRPTLTRWERRAARRLRAELEARQSAGAAADLGEAAAAAGVSAAAAQRAMVRWLSLDEATIADPATEDSFADVGHGLDFLELLAPRDRRVLELRYGIGATPHTLAAAAERLGASPSTVFRWEREALIAARALLSGDRTTVPVSGRSPRPQRLPSSSEPPSRSRTPRRRAEPIPSPSIDPGDPEIAGENTTNRVADTRPV